MFIQKQNNTGQKQNIHCQLLGMESIQYNNAIMMLPKVNNEQGTLPLGFESPQQCSALSYLHLDKTIVINVWQIGFFISLSCLSQVRKPADILLVGSSLLNVAFIA